MAVMTAMTNCNVHLCSSNFLIFLCSSEESMAFWMKWSNFCMWPHITQFDLFDHLMQLLDAADFAAISKQVESEKVKTKEETWTWEANFDCTFNGAEPGHCSGGTQKSWDDSVEQAVPGLTVGNCGRGDDKFSNVDWSHVATWLALVFCSTH
jgi:hypothetical protein